MKWRYLKVGKNCFENAQDLQKRHVNETRFLAAMNYPQTSMEHWISMSAVVCFRWLALFLSLKASYRLHQLRSWGEPEGESQQRYLRNKDFLLGVNFPLSFPNLCSCPLLKVSNYLSINYPCSSTPFSFLWISESNNKWWPDGARKFPEEWEQYIELWLTIYTRRIYLCVCIFVYVLNIYLYITLL